MIAANVPIYVALDPVDMRKSFDALALCVRELGHDPQCGALYVFAGTSGTRLKVLWFHQNGYCLLYKRLHRAVFRLPKGIDPSGRSVEIDLLELGKILDGIALSATPCVRKSCRPFREHELSGLNEQWGRDRSDRCPRLTLPRSEMK